MKPRALNATRFQCLRGRSWFVESKYAAMSLIDNFIYWIVFFYRRWMRRGRSRSFAIRSIAWNFLARRIFITIRPSDGRRHTTKNSDRSPIVTRSRRDRSSIVPRLDLLSSRNHSKLRRWRLTEIQIHDRRSIMAWSWPDRATIWARVEAKLKSILCGIEAASSPQRIAPTTSSNNAHDRFHRPRFRAQFPSLKTHVLLLCSSTFDRFVKELSEFRGRS